MKQKRFKTKKRTNTINMRNKQTALPTAYKPMKPDTKVYQKSSYDNQTDNKENNRNIDMSIGLGEDKNKSKTKTTDQNEDKPSLPKESVITATSSPLHPAQSEVFDSSSDNAMSEMKQIADMGPDEASKVFSHVEEKQQLDPSTTSIDDDTAKKAVPENNQNMNPASDAKPALQERDRSGNESKEEDVVLMQNVKPDIPQNYKKSEKQDQLGESVRFNDELNKEYRSTSLNNDKNDNPFISGLKLWQAYNEIWFNAYNEYVKTWKGMFKTIC
jgi:hypothetical protein